MDRSSVIFMSSEGLMEIMMISRGLSLIIGYLCRGSWFTGESPETRISCNSSML